MKKLAFFLALVMLLSLIVSCKPATDSSNESGVDISDTSTDTSQEETDPNLFNTVEGINNSLIYDIDRSKTYEKVNIINGQSYTLQTEPSSTYPDDGKKLTDTVLGAPGANFSANDWIGFVTKKRIEFTVDLGEKVSGITELGVNVNYSPSEGRTAPKLIDYYISDDGVKFTRVGSSTSTNDFSGQIVYTHLLKLQKGIETRYIKAVLSGITSNWVHIDSFQAYKYKEVVPVTTDNKYYVNDPMPEVKSPEYWSSSDSDFNTKKNLAAGLSQRIYTISPLMEDLKTEYFNTPASTKKLTDGQKGGSSYTGSNFVHFTRGMGREIIYDLGKLSAVDSIAIGMLVDSGPGVKQATAVHIYVSEDGKGWQRISNEIPSNPDNLNGTTIRYEESFDSAYKARFVKLILMIAGHTWVDEIEIFGTKNTAGAKTIVPDANTGVLDGKYPTPDMLGGSDNILLAYNFKVENPEVGLTTKEQYLPYVGYYDKDGVLKDIFFDSYLYLPCMTVCPSGGVLYHNPQAPSFASDWLAYEEDTFGDGYNVPALNEAVGEVTAELGKNDFKAPIYLSIFSTVPTQNNFGDIDGDGISEDFSKVENRKKALKWWIDRQIARFEAGNYDNLKLNGFYWYHEALELGDPNEIELARFTSDYVHSLGYYIIWIPYYQAGGFSEWKTVGFDIANMQPNYMFNETFTEQVVYDNAELTKQLGMGVEIEIDGKVFSSTEYYARYMSYLRVGVETGYMNAIKMYYQDAGPGVFYNAYKSTNPQHRAIYDLTYLYAKGKLTVGELDVEQTEFKGEVNKAMQGSIRIEDSITSVYTTIEISPKYGSVALSQNGSFTYTPLKDFKGTDTFTVKVTNGISSQITEIKVIVE